MTRSLLPRLTTSAWCVGTKIVAGNDVGTVNSDNMKSIAVDIYIFFLGFRPVWWHCFYNLQTRALQASFLGIVSILGFSRIFRANKGDLRQDGPQAVPEGHATPGGDLGPDSACSVEHNRVRDAAGAGGVLHRGGIHEVKAVYSSLFGTI